MPVKSPKKQRAGSRSSSRQAQGRPPVVIDTAGRVIEPSVPTGPPVGQPRDSHVPSPPVALEPAPHAEPARPHEQPPHLPDPPVSSRNDGGPRGRSASVGSRGSRNGPVSPVRRALAPAAHISGLRALHLPTFSSPLAPPGTQPARVRTLADSVPAAVRTQTAGAPVFAPPEQVAPFADNLGFSVARAAPPGLSSSPSVGATPAALYATPLSSHTPPARRSPGRVFALTDAIERLIVADRARHEDTRVANEQLFSSLAHSLASTSAALQALGATTAAHTPNPSSKAVVKVNPPDCFYGKPEKLDGFLLSCYAAFNSSPRAFDDYHKCVFAMSYMRGLAEEWAVLENTANTSTIDDSAPRGTRFLSWPAFELSIRTQFGDPFDCQRAEDFLTTFRQGSTDAQRFLTMFCAKARKTNLSDSALIMLLRRATRLDVWVEASRARPHPVDLDGWKARILAADRHLIELANPVSNAVHYLPKEGSGPQSVSNSSTAPAQNWRNRRPNPAPTPTPTADANHTRSSTRPTPTSSSGPPPRPAQALEKLCWKCKKPGHQWKECPGIREDVIRQLAENLGADEMNDEERDVLIRYIEWEYDDGGFVNADE